jgi:hypothetical protein
MKKFILLYLIAGICMFSLPAFSQGDKKPAPKEDTTEMLGLPGDNLDLYAVLDLFQKSKTIEAFEKSLNEQKTGINNLDLNLDKKIDFIKVVTRKDGDSYAFTLRVDVSKTDSQDVAVILVNRDKNKKVTIQCVGDPDLYGKDYVIEPKGQSSVTANPGYQGKDPVTQDVPASAQTTVVVQQAPIVQYVYSPAYVPYYPPYYYGFYPPFFAFATTVAIGIYRANCWGYHGGYHGGHYGGGNTVIINNGNRNQINHYNNNRSRSNTVSDNRARGNYGSGSANRPGGGASASTRPAGGGSNRPGGGASASTRPANNNNAFGDRSGSGNRPSASTRESGGFSNRSSGSGSFGGGGRSGGGGFGGGGRGGGGGGRRR